MEGPQGQGSDGPEAERGAQGVAQGPQGVAEGNVLAARTAEPVVADRAGGGEAVVTGGTEEIPGGRAAIGGGGGGNGGDAPGDPSGHAASDDDNGTSAQEAGVRVDEDGEAAGAETGGGDRGPAVGGEAGRDPAGGDVTAPPGLGEERERVDLLADSVPPGDRTGGPGTPAAAEVGAAAEEDGAYVTAAASSGAGESGKGGACVAAASSATGEPAGAGEGEGGEAPASTASAAGGVTAEGEGGTARKAVVVGLSVEAGAREAATKELPGVKTNASSAGADGVGDACRPAVTTDGSATPAAVEAVEEQAMASAGADKGAAAAVVDDAGTSNEEPTKADGGETDAVEVDQTGSDDDQVDGVTREEDQTSEGGGEGTAGAVGHSIQGGASEPGIDGASAAAGEEGAPVADGGVTAAAGGADEGPAPTAFAGEGEVAGAVTAGEIAKEEVPENNRGEGDPAVPSGDSSGDDALVEEGVAVADAADTADHETSAGGVTEPEGAVEAAAAAASADPGKTASEALGLAARSGFFLTTDLPGAVVASHETCRAFRDGRAFSVKVNNESAVSREKTCGVYYFISFPLSLSLWIATAESAVSERTRAICALTSNLSLFSRPQWALRKPRRPSPFCSAARFT